jgi:polyhydroxyalkanoate synthesis regulator phasin
MKMDNKGLDKSVHGYGQMLKRVAEGVKGHTVSAIHSAVHKARDLAVELGELSQEEAEKIAEYLKRDLRDMGEFAHKTGKSLHDWLQFDSLMIEAQLLDLILSVADKSRVEWLQFEHSLPQIYQTGEVTGVGYLQCTACGQRQYFHEITPIKACTNCQNTEFKRDKPA